MVDILRLENQHENKELLESLDIVLADFSRSMDAISRSLNDNSRVGPAILDPPLPPHFRTVRARRTRAVGYHIYKNYYDWDPYGYDSESESDSTSEYTVGSQRIGFGSGGGFGVLGNFKPVFLPEGEEERFAFDLLKAIQCTDLYSSFLLFHLLSRQL